MLNLNRKLMNNWKCPGLFQMCVRYNMTVAQSLKIMKLDHSNTPKDTSELKKVYLKLAKVYHPDSA